MSLEPPDRGNRPARGGPLRRLLSVLLAAAALGFVAATIVGHWEELARARWEVRVPQLLASTALLLGVMAAGVWVWGRVLRRFHGGGAPFPTLLRIWFLSGIARYIPGKVWQLVAAAGLAKRAGLGPVVLLSSLLVYMGFGLLSAAVVAAATVPPDLLEVGLPTGALVGAATVAAVLLVHPRIINLALRLVPKALHEEVLAWRGGWLDGVGLLALSAAYWVLYAGAFWLFVDALVDIPPGSVALLGGVNALAFVVGYVVFLVPAGLGVREATLTLLLGSVVGGAGLAGVVAVASRLWIVAAELVGAGASLLLRGPGVQPGDDARA